MEELRLAFLVIGACAIAGIMIHGLWSVRKNSSNKESASLETSDWQDDYDEEEVEDVVLDDEKVVISSTEERSEPKFSASEFDDLGLGAVRVVGADTDQEPTHENTTKNSEDSDPNSEAAETDLSVENESSEEAKPKIYSSVVTQPKPEYAAEQVEAMRSRYAGQDKGQAEEIPEPPPFLLKTSSIDTTETTVVQSANTSHEEAPAIPTETSEHSATDTGNPEPVLKSQNVEPAKPEEPSKPEETNRSEELGKPSLASQVKSFVKPSKTSPQKPKRREPKLKPSKVKTDQMKIDFDEPSLDIGEQDQVATESSASPLQQEVLVLNVKASEDNPIAGAALLPMLLTLGFKFGDQDIFHRHVNSNGKGPVLFSLANMFKPGVFDIDNLENFSTQGVSLFMMLPIEGDPHQVFNMMHNAARKISEEFASTVLDGRRNPLTKQGLQQYVEKIREFERQRLIQR